MNRPWHVPVLYAIPLLPVLGVVAPLFHRKCPSWSSRETRGGPSATRDLRGIRVSRISSRQDDPGDVIHKSSRNAALRAIIVAPRSEPIRFSPNVPFFPRSAREASSAIGQVRWLDNAQIWLYSSVSLFEPEYSNSRVPNQCRMEHVADGTTWNNRRCSDCSDVVAPLELASNNRGRSDRTIALRSIHRVQNDCERS